MNNGIYVFSSPLRVLSVIGIILVSMLLGGTVVAKENGKSGRTAVSSAGCASCHASTASNAVSVAVSATTPLTVAPGGTIQLNVVVSHATASVAGIDIDVATGPDGIAAGVLSAPAGSGLKVSGGELVHASPKPFVNGQASFPIEWTAPTTPGTYTLRAVALAANGNGSDDGSDVWNRLPETTIIVEGTPPPAKDPVTVMSPNGGERYHPGETIAIIWDAAIPVARQLSRRSDKVDRLMSDDDDSDDDDSDDDDSDDDDSDDDDSDDDDSDDDDSDDDDSDDDDSDDDDSTSTNTGLWLRIEWSAEGASGPWSMIADSISAGLKRYEWIAPNLLTDNAWVRVTRLDAAGAFDLNDNAFSIVDSTTVDSAGIVVAHPVSGETVASGSVYRVQWSGSSEGAVTLVWNQCGAGWTAIAENIPASWGQYDWVIPASMTGVATVRILDAQTQVVRAEVRNLSVKPIVSTVDEDAAGLFTIAPHPVSVSSDALMTLPSVPGHIEIVDMNGRRMVHLRTTGDVLLPTKALHAGTYLVRWTAETGTTWVKVIAVSQ